MISQSYQIHFKFIIIHFNASLASDLFQKDFSIKILYAACSDSHRWLDSLDLAGSEVYPISCIMGAGGSSPGVKLPAREADHSPPCNEEAKNEWSYTFTPPCVFMTW